MKITEYPKVEEPKKDDLLIIDNETDGTRTVDMETLVKTVGGSSGVMADPSWVTHRNTYRGKYLGDTYTDEQKAMVANNTFDDLYVGDYWTIGGFDWQIADINYWFGNYNKATNPNEFLITPHLVIVPTTYLYKHRYHDSVNVSNGYAGSEIRSTGLNNAKTIINNAFGPNHILKYREELVNNFTEGRNRGTINTEAYVELMSQIMYLGWNLFPQAYTQYLTYNLTKSKGQLSLFQLKPDTINSKIDNTTLVCILTRDITPVEGGGAKGSIACVSESGTTFPLNPTSSDGGIRPVFGVIG